MNYFTKITKKTYKLQKKQDLIIYHIKAFDLLDNYHNPLPNIN